MFYKRFCEISKTKLLRCDIKNRDGTVFIYVIDNRDEKFWNLITDSFIDITDENLYAYEQWSSDIKENNEININSKCYYVICYGGDPTKVDMMTTYLSKLVAGKLMDNPVMNGIFYAINTTFYFCFQSGLNIGIAETIWGFTPFFSGVLEFLFYKTRLQTHHIIGILCMFCAASFISLSQLFQSSH